MSPSWRLAAEVLAITIALVAMPQRPFACEGREQRDSLARTLQKIRPAVVVVEGTKADSKIRHSGVIVDAGGVVATTPAAIEGIKQVEIVLADRRRLTSISISSNPRAGLAIIRVKSDRPLPCANLAASQRVVVGESVLHVAVAHGESLSVTRGLVSAKDRKLAGGTKGIQVDTAISPPWSGSGPLFDFGGELVGFGPLHAGRADRDLGLFAPSDRIREMIARSLANQ